MDRFSTFDLLSPLIPTLNESKITRTTQGIESRILLICAWVPCQVGTVPESQYPKPFGQPHLCAEVGVASHVSNLVGAKVLGIWDGHVEATLKKLLNHFHTPVPAV